MSIILCNKWSNYARLIVIALFRFTRVTWGRRKVTSMCIDYRGNSIEVEAFPRAGAIKMRENASSRRSAVAGRIARAARCFLRRNSIRDEGSLVARTSFCNSNVLARRKVTSRRWKVHLLVIRIVKDIARASSFLFLARAISRVSRRHYSQWAKKSGDLNVSGKRAKGYRDRAEPITLSFLLSTCLSGSLRRISRSGTRAKR